MEEEIDLRPYIVALGQKWHWILGTAVVTAVFAFIIVSILPPTYQATALVAIGEPNQRVQFDPRIQDVNEGQPLKAYPELALSDTVLQEVLTAVALPDVTVVEELRSSLTAESGADPSLLRLSAQHNDPQKTAEISNVWADSFILHVDTLYGKQGGTQLAFYQQQLAQAEQELAVASQSLIDFQARNRVTLLSNELDALSQAQVDYFAQQRQIASLMRDAQALRDQLTEQTFEPTFSDQMNGLLLQVRTFNNDMMRVGDGGTAVPIQVQLDNSTPLSDLTRREQIAYLEGLVTTLTTRLEAIEVSLADLEPQILALQQEKETAVTEELQLSLRRNVTVETYTTLSRKVAEEQISSQDVNSGVKLASQAAVPSVSTNVNTIFLTMVGGFSGMVLAMLISLLATWWSSVNRATNANYPSESHNKLG